MLQAQKQTNKNNEHLQRDGIFSPLLSCQRRSYPERLYFQAVFVLVQLSDNYNCFSETVVWPLCCSESWGILTLHYQASVFSRKYKGMSMCRQDKENKTKRAWLKPIAHGRTSTRYNRYLMSWIVAVKLYLMACCNTFKYLKHVLKLVEH